MPVVSDLDRELATYNAHRDELVGSSLKKYVLIHGTEIIGTYETEQDAINEGYRRFGNVPFLVKQVLASERPLNFVSGLVQF